jgi:hypothetical protein
MTSPDGYVAYYSPFLTLDPFEEKLELANLLSDAVIVFEN